MEMRYTDSVHGNGENVVVILVIMEMRYTNAYKWIVGYEL